MKQEDFIELRKQTSSNLAQMLRSLEQQKAHVEDVVAAIRDALGVPDAYILMVGGNGLLGFAKTEAVESIPEE